MMTRDVRVSSSEYIKSPLFQLHTWSIAGFILVLNARTTFQLYDLLKTYDDTMLLWESTAVNSLTTTSPSRRSKNVKSITKRDIADW